MKRIIERVLNALATGAHVLGCVAITAMMLHVSGDVLLKYLANRPIEGTLEFVSTYYMVSVVFLPLAYVTWKEGHVEVEIFTQTLPARAQHLIQVFASVVSALYCGLLAWRGGVNAVRSTAVGEVWASALIDIPVWPTRWLFPLGCGLAGATFLLVALRHLAQAQAAAAADVVSAPKRLKD